MRPRIAVLSGVLAALAVGGLGLAYFAGAQTDTGRPDQVTIRGEVVDLGCYLRMGEKGTGAGHAACAVACAKMGIPQGILDERTGSIYLNIGPSMMGAKGSDLKDFAAKRVEVRGRVFSAGGIQGIEVASVKEIR